MKISPRHLFLCAAAAFSLALTSAVFAQDNKQPDPPPPATSTETPPAATVPPADKPAEETATVAPAPAESSAAAEPAADKTTVAPSEPAAVSAEPAPAPAPEAQPKVESSEPPALRRLDKEDENSVTPKSRKEKVHERIERAHQRAAWVRANRVGRDIVNVFSDSELPKGEKADNVVATFGNSTAEGDVTDSVVAVFGNARASGAVGDAVVAVMGDGEVTGPVGDSVVVVLGNLSVNSHIQGDIVTVLGDITFGPNAEVGGDVVCVGGTVTRSPQAVLHHGVQKVGMGHLHSGAGLKAWIRECLMYGRPLAFGPHLMWVWWIALFSLAFYVVVALLFGKGVNKCIDTLEQRPGYSILTALLTLVLTPIVIIVLAFTGIGIAVLPFLAVALYCASLFGKVVILAWIGRRVGKFLGVSHPALATLVGGVIVLFLYTIWGSFILYTLIRWLGMGVVVYTLILAMKREKPPVVPVPPVIPPAPGGTQVDPVTGEVLATPGLVVPVALVPSVMAAVSLPRAGFWIRLAALLLDVIIVGMLCSLLSGLFPRGAHIRIQADLLPALALYGALMWKLRGSTVGGIVCGLKVIRLDDRPVDWGTAIVRALSCFLSLFVMGLGFIWVAFDDQRQSWHDKIAGTTVVRVPKGVSLV